MAQMYPLGVRTDGSYYTRIEWASHTETDPMLWVLNVIDDDVERNGGTWGQHLRSRKRRAQLFRRGADHVQDPHFPQRGHYGERP